MSEINAVPVSELIRQHLAALMPLELEVHDESELHKGHAGAGKGGHYRVRIVSAVFEKQPRIARHRKVLSVLSDLMAHHIHALSVQAATPAEVVSGH